MHDTPGWFLRPPTQIFRGKSGLPRRTARNRTPVAALIPARDRPPCRRAAFCDQAGKISMRRQRGYVVGSIGVAVALLSFAVALETEVATATVRSGIDQSTINRALKGDRLPLIPGTSGAKPAPVVPEPSLPAGCASFHRDAAKNAFLSEVPGRCVAFAPEHRLVAG